MQFIESLSFSYALVISGLIALILSIVPGLAALKRRKVRTAPAIAVVESFEEFEVNRPIPGAYLSVARETCTEISSLVSRLGSVMDRIDDSVNLCLEGCGELIDRGSGIITMAGLSETMHDARDIASRINDLKDLGVDESGIAGKLKIDNELVRLYMHVGG
ncbi:MAG: hypothetical protein JW814_10405 [Candidatus Krumholzibacteriota bacterium]|nr:hypothetical protein [Candidatus Krumholzibacteriota bacterium]